MLQIIDKIGSQIGITLHTNVKGALKPIQLYCVTFVNFYNSMFSLLYVGYFYLLLYLFHLTSEVVTIKKNSDYYIEPNQLFFYFNTVKRT